MNQIILLLFIVSVSFLLGCKKNTAPEIITLGKIQPNYTTADSIISFKFKANDLDGDLINHQLYINSILVKETTTENLLYDFEITTNDLGDNTFKIVAFDENNLKSTYSSSFFIKDYRNPYLGEFRFYTKQISSTFGDTTLYIDTFIYDGIIREFELIDSQSNQYPYDESHENPNKKITIQFLGWRKITPSIMKNGDFIPKGAPHYYHEGKFSSSQDTINFKFNSGSLSFNNDFTVFGIRK